MNDRRGIVLDANILLRAVFGQRVRHILNKYEDRVRFYTPDTCLREAQKYTATISEERRLDPGIALSVLEHMATLVEQVGPGLYGRFELSARERIGHRDPDDWPVVAVALALNLPIWTEDQDFFGSGVAIWTTDRVEMYLNER